jgi:hypothetical protein
MIQIQNTIEMNYLKDSTDKFNSSYVTLNLISKD